MRLEWDERKNSQNIQKHGFDFSDAEELFTGLYPLLVAADKDYGEERWRGIGMIQAAS